MKTLRYIISGGTGAFVNLGSMFILTHSLHVWYLILPTGQLVPGTYSSLFSRVQNVGGYTVYVLH